ncbi:MAG: ParB N-terminal domain-containing protein [Alphaproteobacteria bacterium]|nr:ParB N-terminal domain-containing protein [Alphaproteobacteria bacterium]
MQNSVTTNSKKVGKKMGDVKMFLKTTIQQIPIDQIYLGKYQKRLSKKRVADIVAKFNPNRMRPIEVSLRDGKYWCWDGQHRLAAYKLMGIDLIECQVHHGLTYEDEARLFAEQQDNVGSITTAHKFNALKEAGDPQTLRIIKKCSEYGFTVHPTKPGGKNIRSIKALQSVEKTLGCNRLGDIVWIMKSAWDHSPESTHENIIGGLGLFLKRYLLPENTAKEYEINNAVINRLHDSLSTVEAKKLLQESTKFYGFNGNKRVALAMVELYNKRPRKGGQSRLARFDL